MITTFSLIFLTLFMSMLSHADFELGYREFSDPTLDMAVQGMRMHQIQWYNYGIYTANLNTPGYTEIGGYGYRKGDKLMTMPFYRWRHGPVMETNRMLDFYVDANGKGFFVINILSGLAFTKDGRLMLDKNRRVVMQNGGFPVLGENGEIYLPEGEEIHVTSTGLVMVDGEPVDRFKIVVFDDYDEMQNLETINGSVFYLKKEIATLAGPEHYKIRQGFIEQNNVLKALVGDMKFALKGYEYGAKTAKTVAKILGDLSGVAGP